MLSWMNIERKSSSGVNLTLITLAFEFLLKYSHLILMLSEKTVRKEVVEGGVFITCNSNILLP